MRNQSGAIAGQPGESAEPNVEQKHEIVLSRRALLAGAGAFALGCLLPWKSHSAWGDPWWDDGTIFRGNGNWYGNQYWSDIGSVYGRGGGWQSGTAYTERGMVAETPWVEWDLSWNQFIRTAVQFVFYCDFTTELYHHFVGQINIACGDYNGYQSWRNLWHTDSGDDTRYKVYRAINDSPDGGAEVHSKQVVIDDETPGTYYTDNPHHWTGYRNYNYINGNGVVDFDMWQRRSPGRDKVSLQLRCWFWNYYYYGTDWYGSSRWDNPPIGYSTKWLEQHCDTIYIKNQLCTSHRILEIIPNNNRSMRLDVVGAGRNAGTNVVIWSAYEATNQNWMSTACSDLDRRGTISFEPVNVGNGSLWLDHSGGGPQKGPTTAQLWTGNGSRAQAFWLHDNGAGGYFVFADCSGLALDVANGDMRDGVNVQFHSNGYCADEWSNTSHQWVLKDALFHIVNGQVFSGNTSSLTADVGDVLSPDDPDVKCRPRNYSGTNGLYYNYKWIRTAEPPDYLSDYVEVKATASISSIGALGTQLGRAIVGSAGQGLVLEKFSLTVDGSSLDGSLRYSVKLAGGSWQDGADGSEVGSSGSRLKGLKVWLDGRLAECYDVVYNLNCSNIGWAGEGRNGAETSNGDNDIEAFRVVLWPKNIVSNKNGDGSYATSEADSDAHLTCFVTAWTRSGDRLYCGNVKSTSVYVRDPMIKIRFFADGLTTPCYECERLKGEAFSVPAEANAAALQEGCSGLDGWFIDPAYVTRFADGTVLSADTDLYARNRVTITYANNTDDLPSGQRYAASRNGSLVGIDAACSLPAPMTTAYYGALLSLAEVGDDFISYTDDSGRWLDLQAEGGWHLKQDCSDAAHSSIRLTASATVWKRWEASTFDGIREDAR